MIALAVDPADTNIVYAGSDRVSKSTDGGHSWKTVFPPHATPNRETVSALAIAPTHPEAIYAITDDFGPIVGDTRRADAPRSTQSTDAGATWQATTVVRGNVAPTALAVDPRDPTTVYAAIGARVMKTTNAGKTWQPIAHGLPITHTRGTCHCLSQGGVTTLAVDPRRSGTVYAALTQGGIYKTTNGGQTWSRVTTLGLHRRGRPRTPGDDLRRRPEPDRGWAPDSQKHRRRPHLGHGTVTQSRTMRDCRQRRGCDGYPGRTGRGWPVRYSWPARSLLC